VWVEPEDELLPVWREQRDVFERGYSRGEANSDPERRKALADTFIAPQSRYADLTLTFYRPPDYAAHENPSLLSARIRKGGRFRALDYSEFESSSTSIRQIEESDGRFPETIIELDGHIERDTFLSVEERLWRHIDFSGNPTPQLGQFRDAQGHERTGYALALAQLLIARRVVLVEHELLETVQ
jgi:hypothetical protein